MHKMKNYTAENKEIRTAELMMEIEHLQVLGVQERERANAAESKASKLTLEIEHLHTAHSNISHHQKANTMAVQAAEKRTAELMTEVAKLQASGLEDRERADAAESKAAQ